MSLNVSTKHQIKRFLRTLGIGITTAANLERLERSSAAGGELIEFLAAMPSGQLPTLLANATKSKSQLRQDLFALSEHGCKRDGFFVEFGATDGIRLSNSFLLEKEFGWTGILAEPAKGWHPQLKLNRTAFIETNCVWKESGKTISFRETEDGELSTLEHFSKTADIHQSSRKRGSSYPVQTISLADLLAKYNAPNEIDYLSIDTEGSELDILAAFDFARRKIKVITCEHNFGPTRQPIYDLLTNAGYTRKFEHLSKFDDWYVL